MKKSEHYVHFCHVMQTMTVQSHVIQIQGTEEHEDILALLLKNKSCLTKNKQKNKLTNALILLGVGMI